MDRVVNVRMFSVEVQERGAMPFSAALRHVAGLDLADRDHEIEPDLAFRLERLNDQQGLLSGEIVRRQTTNLPAKALRGRPLERLGVNSIGHSSAFVFDPRFSVLALQIARNGISATRIALYLEALAGGAGYSILPIPSGEIWERLRHGAVRGITFRVSSPNELQEIDAETRSIRRGVMAMKSSLMPTRVEVTMSMTRGEEDLNRQKAVGVFQWLQRERQSRRGGVSRLVARIIPQDGEDAEVLNLISGQMGAKEWVDLPDDEPDASYRRRHDYILRVLRANRSALESMYG